TIVEVGTLNPEVDDVETNEKFLPGNSSIEYYPSPVSYCSMFYTFVANKLKYSASSSVPDVQDITTTGTILSLRTVACMYPSADVISRFALYLTLLSHAI